MAQPGKGSSVGGDTEIEGRDEPAPYVGSGAKSEGLLNPLFSDRDSPQKLTGLFYFIFCGLADTPDTRMYGQSMLFSPFLFLNILVIILQNYI